MVRSVTKTVLAAAVMIAWLSSLALADVGGVRDDGSFQRKSVVITEYRNHPQSWTDAIKTSDLVATIKVRKLTYQDDDGRAVTRFEADVVEVLGGARAASVGRQIVVSRFGGMTKKGGASVFVEEQGFPEWKMDKTCVVFLTWSEQSQSYWLPYGPDSSFELEDTNNKVRTYGHGALATRQKGRAFADMVRELKTHRR